MKTVIRAGENPKPFGMRPEKDSSMSEKTRTVYDAKAQTSGFDPKHALGDLLVGKTDSWTLTSGKVDDVNE